MATNFDSFFSDDPFQEKKVRVDEALREKVNSMGQPFTPQEMDVLVRKDRGDKGRSLNQNQLINDLRRASPLEMYVKYGPNAAQIMDEYNYAENRYNVESQQQRDTAAIVGDAINSMLTQGVSGIAGLVNLGVGAIDPTTGAAISEGVGEFQKDMQGLMSERAQIARARNAIDNQLTRADNQALYEQDRASGTSDFLATAKREGRNFMSAIDNATDDAVIFGDGLSGAVGSLFSSSLLGSIISKGGQAVLKGAVASGAVKAGSRAATLIEKIGSKLTMPLAIAGTEAGSAYQQTSVQVLQMDHTKLMADSPEYAELINEGWSRDDAKIEIASRAGMMAAGIQAPVAALTGALVSRFERAPFKTTAFGSNIVREGTEETIQGISGTMAQNRGVQIADQNQELTEGAGEAGGLGLLYGAGVGGVISAPSAALNNTVKAAKLTVDAGKSVLNPIMDRGRATIEKLKAIPRERAREAAIAATEAVPEIAEAAVASINEMDGTEEQKSAAQQYIDQVTDGFSIRPNDVEYLGSSPNLANRLADVSTQVELIEALTDAVKDPDLDIKDKVLAGRVLFNTAEDFMTTIDSAPDLIQSLPQTHPLRDLEATLINMLGSKEAAEAIQAYQGILQGRAPTLDADRDAEEMLAVAQATPEAINIEAAKTMLKHAETGKITLSPIQKKYVQAAVALAETAAAFLKRETEAGFKPRDFVTQDILTSEKGWEQGSTPSAKGHMRRIVSNVRRGDIEGARAALQDLSLFAKHMQNKVAALNESIASDDWDGQRKVRYIGLTPQRTWRRVAPESALWVNPKFPSSIKIAKQIANEALALAELTNKMSEAFPELGVEHIDAIQLDPFMNGTTAEIQERFQQMQQPVVEEAQVVDNTLEIVQEPEVNDVASKVDEVLNTVEEIQPEPEVIETPVQEVETKEQALNPDVSSLSDKLLGGITSVLYNGIRLDEGGVKVALLDEEKQALRDIGIDADSDIISDKDAELLSNERASRIKRSSPKKESKPIEPEKPKSVTPWFAKAYSKRDGSNYNAVAQPIAEALTALNNSASLRKALGTLNFAYDTATAEGYVDLLADAGKAVIRMEERLAAFLNAPHSKADKTSRKEKLLNGEPYAEYDTGKVLNITEQDADGNINYNSNLVELAALAAMQWRLGEYRSKPAMDREDIANRLGIPEEQVTAAMITFFNDNTLLDEAVRGISNKIKDFWGVTPDRNTSVGMTQGILEGTAKEIIASLEDNGFLKTEEIKLGRGNDTRTFITVTMTPDTIADAVYNFPNALDKLIVKAPDDVLYIGEKPTSVMQNQINNAQVPLTTDQKNVLDFENQQPFITDTTMLSFNEMLDEDGVMFLYGSGEVDPAIFNVNHAATLQGKNNTLMLGFDLMKKTALGVKSAAKELRQELSQIPIYYTYGFNRVNRMQMNGRANPQSNKLLREVFLPTWSELDLTTEAHAEAFDLALGQAFGLKIHKMTIPDIRTAVADRIANSYAGTIDILEGWLTDGKSLTSEQLQTIKDEIGSSHPELVLHALMEVARSKQGNGLFTTSLYLEADGITNGVINSLSIFNTGDFTPAWVENMQRGGVFYGRKDMTMNEFANGEGAGKPDIYETLAGRLKGRLNSLWQEYQDVILDKFADEDQKLQAANFFGTMKLLDLFSTDINMTDEDIDIARGITKNPMTQLTYQAGAKSIATRIASDFTDKLYERMTRMGRAFAEDKNISPAEAMFGDYGPMADAKYEEFTSSWSVVFGSDFDVRNAKEAFEFNINTADFNRYLIPSISENFSIPLMEEARSILGEGNTTVNDTVRVATQVQSIIYAHEFQKKVTEAIDQKKAAGLRDVSLSPKEMDDIHNSIKDLAANVNTSKQNWLIGKGTTNPQNDLVYSKTLNGKLQTTARMFLPADAGVSGVPNLTIGSGDGLMMQNLSSDHSVINTLKVYDGVNVPLDKVKEYSIAANKAVLDSWNQTEVISSVRKSYEALASAYDLGDVTDTNLVKALADAVIHPGASRSKMSQAEMRDIVRTRLLGLRDALARVDEGTSKRYEVMRKVGISVDQMAGGNTGFYRDGTVLAGNTAEELAAELNALMNPTPEATVEPTSFDEIGRVDRSGSTIISQTALGNLLKKLVAKKEITSDQEVMMRQIIRSGAAKDYTLVYGNRDQLVAHALNNDKAYPEGLNDADTRGLIDPSSKTIYYTTSSVETLLHELIHATTLEAVIGVYNGTETNTEIVQAVNNIRTLANQFMKLEAPIDSIDAVENMKDTIRRERNDPTRSKSLNEAIALNEFMAWVLANPDLANQAKAETSLVQMAKDVIKYIKNLIWGRKQAPKPLTDILSNLQFNAAVLIRSRADTKTQFVDSMLYHSENFGQDNRLNIIQDALAAKFGHLMDEANVETLADNINDKERFSLKTTILLNALRGNGFNMTEQEASTFRLLVGALGTQIELDPNSLNRVQELYNHVLKDLKPESFMVDPNSNDPADIYIANAKYNMIVGKGAYFKDSAGRSTLLPMFMALANVNSEFRSVLRNMPVPKAKQAAWDSLDNILTNTGSIMMDKLQASLSGEKNAPEIATALLNITDNMIEVAQDRKGFFEQLAGSAHQQVNRANEIIREGMSNFAERNIKKMAERLPEAGKTEKIMIGLGTGILAALNQETAEKAAQGTISFLNGLKIPQAMTDLANDLIGRTDENKDIYDLIKGSRTLVEQFRQKFREGVPQAIGSKFKREVRKAEWTAMHTAMGKTDLAALNNLLTDQEVLKVLQDDAFLEATIAEYEAKILGEFGSDYPLVEAKMKQLAEFMITGKPGPNLLRNAYAISQLWNEKPAVRRRAVSDMPTDNIDALVTLYALQLVPDQSKDLIVELAREEAEGMNFVYKYLVGQRTHEMNKAEYSISKANGFKGYIPSTGSAGQSLIVADDAGFADLRLRGFARIGDYEHASTRSSNRPMGYYYTSNNGRAMFNAGIVQNARDTAQGVDTATGASIHVPTAYRITDAAEIARLKLQMKKNVSTPLMPVYSNDGEIIAFEASIDPNMAASLERDTHMGNMLGVWRGRQAEEEAAKTINARLVKALADMYHKDTMSVAAKNRSDEYINLYDYQNLNPVVRDAVSLFTPQLKEMISAYFPRGEFWVRKDMLNDAIGYRSASFGDFWTGANNISPEVNKRIAELAVGLFGPKAYEYATKAQSYWQNVISDARVLIAVKSGVVPITNFISNFYHMMIRGVPINDLIKKTPRKISEINSYIKSRVEEIELEAEIRAATDNPVKRRNLQVRLKAIQDNHRRMSIWPLIEAGEFTSISDVDVSREELQLAEGRLADYIESLTARLPSGVKTAARYAVITKDTALFQGMQRAVEYGDFIAKAIMYDDIVKRQGLSKEYALGRITEEFVNYDRLSGRFRQMLENNGLLWFYNFKIRSVKIGISMLRNNPLTSLIGLNLPMPTTFGSVGTPITDNLFSIGADGKLGWSIGPGMGVNSLGMHPWVAAVN